MQPLCSKRWEVVPGAWCSRDSLACPCGVMIDLKPMSRSNSNSYQYQTHVKGQYLGRVNMRNVSMML